jgi:hypothetical protein
MNAATCGRENLQDNIGKGPLIVPGVMYPQFHRGRFFGSLFSFTILTLPGFQLIIVLPSVKDVGSAPAEQGSLHASVCAIDFVTGVFLLSRSR